MTRKTTAARPRCARWGAAFLIPFLLTLLLRAPVAKGSLRLALGPQVCQALLSSDDSKGWDELRASLGAEMRHPEVAVNRLARHAVEIESVGRFLGSGVVGVVYEVQTTHGPRALKIYTEGSLKFLGRGVLLQQLLGFFGLAPKVDGVLSRSQLRKVIEASPALRDHMHPDLMQFGLLMEKIDGVATGHITEAFAREHGVSYDALARQVREAERVLGHLRIVPEDGQVMVMPSGRLVVHDFDYYHWVGLDGHAYSFEENGTPAEPYPSGPGALDVSLGVL